MRRNHTQSGKSQQHGPHLEAVDDDVDLVESVVCVAEVDDRVAVVTFLML